MNTKQVRAGQATLSLNKKTKIKMCASDATLQIVTSILLVAILIIVGYPVIFIISSSFSSAKAIAAGRVILWPVDFSLAGYEFVLQYQDIYTGYRNTTVYTVAATAVNLIMTILCAYPLSKRNFQGRSKYMMLFFITMFFGAGMIPNYLVKSQYYGLVNNPLVMIIPGAIGTHNMIILRTAFRSSIPGELFEAAKIDGSSDFQCLYRIAVPLAKPTISVITLYYAVGHWNSYFSAMLYFRDKSLFPLSLFLRNILTASAGLDTGPGASAGMQELAKDATESIKFSLIIVSTVPVLLLYALVQKYFKKGVMIGAVKG